ncbi:hypothetical protein M9Y10_016623 [Tritrichomonas musculus]|uniref:Uncharacterized protein n=1 Tax=Tritrichomonas musculus TaxID=1915356 RepID=A0ABR2HX24_9EUKA
MTQSKCPSSLNFVLVRLWEEKTQSRKVLLPNSLVSLKKNIRALFKLNEPVSSLYTEDGHPIQFLNEIVPGEIIYASTTDINFQSVSKKAPPSPSIFREGAANTYISSPNQDPKVSTPRSKSPGSSKLPKPRTSTSLDPKYEIFGLTPNVVALGNGLSPLLVDQSKLHHTRLDTRSFRKSQAEESEEDIAWKKKQKELEKYVEQMPDLLKSLFGLLDGDGNNKNGASTWIDDIMPLLNSLPLSEKVIIVDAARISKEQNEYWLYSMNKLLSELFQGDNENASGLDTTKLIGLDDTALYIGTIIENHRFVSFGEVSYSMKCHIVGPRKSGKTTFLRLFSQRLLNEFAQTGNINKKFIVPFDMKRLSVSLTNYAQFYSDMVDIVCRALSLQRPLLDRLIKTEVKPFLLSVMKNDSPVFKKSLLNQHECKEFFNNVQAIGELLNLFWNDSQCLTQWFTNVSYLPNLIAGAAGYDETVYIIDNFDYCDQCFLPSERFADSDERIFVSEYFKFALMNSSFITACEDESKLYQVLTDVEDSFPSIQYEYLSMEDIQSDAANDEVVLAQIEGIKQQLTLKPEMCSGIPAYIAVWNGITEIIKNVEKQSVQQNDESEDTKLLAAAQAQKFIQTAFVITNDENDVPLDHIIVTDVKLKKSNESK